MRHWAAACLEEKVFITGGGGERTFWRGGYISMELVDEVQAKMLPTLWRRLELPRLAGMRPILVSVSQMNLCATL